MTMTDRQPVTEAGRALLRLLESDASRPFLRSVMVENIRDVEGSASQLSERRTAELVEALRRLVAMWRTQASQPLNTSGLAAQAYHDAAVTGCAKQLEDVLRRDPVALRALAATDTTAPDAEREE